MRSNPERIAWIVLASAFVVFCLLAAGIPLAIRSYLLNAMEDMDAQLQVIEGTVLVQKANGSQPIGVMASDGAVGLSPEDAVITDNASWVTLDLFDRSHVTLYSNSKAQLTHSRTHRFRLSSRPNQITLNLTGGLMRVGVALPGERSTSFQVLTPHTLIELEEGSYRIEVANEETLVTVVRGEAAVGQDAAQMLVPQGTRTSVDLSGQPGEPLPSARNLIQNGDLQQPLQTGWLTSTVVLAPSVMPPSIELTELGGRTAVRLVRREQDDGNHTEASIQQKLAQNVRDFLRLEVSLDVRLDFQSLSGGGQLSSEYPIIVRLDYKDRWGNDKFWTHGFYYQNRDGYPIALDPWGRPSGEQIRRGVWYPYESGNLLELLGDNRPVDITGLTVYASGWNYDSLVSEIQLIVE
jgi:hypothetical protein